MDSKYIVDTNVFISAYRSAYPMDIFPSFWEQLIIKGGRNIVLLDKVYEELSVGDDLLLAWVKENRSNFCNVSCGEPGILTSYRDIGDFLDKTDEYKDSAKSEYFSVADSWICAAAKANNFTIVTREKTSNSKKRIKVPYICGKFSIRCIDTVEFIREIKMKL